MELDEELAGNTAVLVPRGRIDSTTAPALDERLATMLARPADALVLDLSQLEYLSSAGFRVLLVSQRLARSKAVPLRLCGLSEKLRQLFELAGFIELFEIHGQRADAVAAGKPGAATGVHGPLRPGAVPGS